ncbi:hypothetical protein FJZ19_03220 [Candidatus Pacearchaeota archaeon]|nr:hypothetical protein [Candidatus Pacearchaeota archaeon]
MNKKKVAIFVTSILALILVSSFVLAQEELAVNSDVQNALNKIAEVVNPIAQFIVGPAKTIDLLFVKVLFLILIFGVAYYAAGFTPGLKDSTFFMLLISVVIALLATRFLATPELITFIWLPSGTAGMAFATLFPFVLFFFLINKIDNFIITRVGWVIFIVIYFAMAIYRWYDLAPKGGEWWNTLAWWYMAIGVISILVLVFDKNIRAWMMLAELKGKTSKRNILQMSRFTEDLREYEKAAHNLALTDAQRNTAKDEAKKIRKQIAELASE